MYFRVELYIHADSIRSEIDTIPDNDTLNALEADIINFETSVKAAMHNFTSGLLNIVQDGFVAQGNGAVFASIAENYDQMMESTNSNKQRSANETFVTSA